MSGKREDGHIGWIVKTGGDCRKHPRGTLCRWETAGEEGYVLVVTLMVLLLLTMIGITSMTSATFESAVVKNEVSHDRHFYLAESGVQEALQHVENLPLESADPVAPQLGNLATIPWIHERVSAPDFTDPANWDVEGADANARKSTFDPDHTWFAVVEERVDSLDPTKPALRYYSVFSMTNVGVGLGAGRVMLQVGYKRRI